MGAKLVTPLEKAERLARLTENLTALTKARTSLVQYIEELKQYYKPTDFRVLSIQNVLDGLDWNIQNTQAEIDRVKGLKP